MTRYADFAIVPGDNWEIRAQWHGNNIAFECPKCNHPVLATARAGYLRLPGCDEKNPTICKDCGTKYFLEVNPDKEIFYIHAIKK